MPNIVSPRLYLMASQIPDLDVFLPSLDKACASADVASFLLQLPAEDSRSQTGFIKTVAPIAQKYNTAVIVSADKNDEFIRTALRGGADGVHLSSDMSNISEIRKQLGADHILGTAVATKDEAMLAGEAGVDYIWFGENRTDKPISLAQLHERVSWWTEIFEIPCVAYADTWDAVEQLASAKAEFIAVDRLVWQYDEGEAAAVQKVNDILRKYTVVE